MEMTFEDVLQNSFKTTNISLLKNLGKNTMNVPQSVFYKKLSRFTPLKVLVLKNINKILKVVRNCCCLNKYRG